MPSPIPNRLPQLPATARTRLALVLSWPSEEDCRIGRPLNGAAGAFLRGTLSAAGLLLEECAVCHVVQYYVPTWESAGWESEAVQNGIAALSRDLTAWRPNLVLGLDDPRLGAGVLHLFKYGNVAPRRTPSGYQWESKLGKWRGSLFRSQCFGGVAKEAALSTRKPSGVGEGNPDLLVSNPAAAANFVGSSTISRQLGSIPKVMDSNHKLGSLPGDSAGAAAVLSRADRDPANTTVFAAEPSPLSFKTLCSYHPSYVHAVWDKAFDLRQDVRRAAVEAGSAQLNLPELRICYGPVE